MRHLVSGIHQPSVASFGFRQISPPLGFGETWMSYEVPEEVGAGNYHLYSPTGQWSIAIHDFTLARDSPLSFTLPDYVSVTWYESIAGEQYDPPRVLRSDHVAGYCSRPTGWHALVRGQVPIRSVGVEVTPEYSHRYLDAEYGGQFSGVADAFESLNTDGSNWPQLRAKLMRLWPKAGESPRSCLWYEGVVLQVLGLLVERTRSLSDVRASRTSADDQRRIHSVMAHIDRHHAEALALGELANLACMGQTKFKESFRAVAGVSAIGYLHRCRIRRAKELLRRDDLTIAHVASAVGYASPGRFAELFRRETGLRPSQYRVSMR